MKTGTQIQADIITLLSGSTLADAINGQIYHTGHRPAGSTTEDITVAFGSGTVEQIETGTVTLNICVPDTQNNTTGAWLQNIQRCRQLETTAAQWVESLTTATSDYRLALQQTISCQPLNEMQQHTIAVKLKYELLNN